VERGKNKEWLGHMLNELAYFTLQNDHIHHEIITNMFFNLIRKVKDKTIHSWLTWAQLIGYAIRSLQSMERIRENLKSSWKQK